MSLLSDTNHTPQRMFALLRLLDCQDGQLSFPSIRTWLKPTLRGVEQKGSEEDSNIRQLLGAASSLGFIGSPAQNQYKLTAPVPATIEEFADAVHDRLVSLDMSHADSIVLEAFAAMVIITEAEAGTSWLDLKVKDLAARIDAAVRGSEKSDDDDDDEKKRFNGTKSPAWKRWMVFLGLGVPMPKCDFYPYPAQRLSREIVRLRVEGALQKTVEFDAFLSQISKRMPYLDTGQLFISSSERVRLAPPGRQLSRVLSATLRDLHDDKEVVLKTIGDAKEMYSLIGAPHFVKNVKAITFAGQNNDD